MTTQVNTDQKTQPNAGANGAGAGVSGGSATVQSLLAEFDGQSGSQPQPAPNPTKQILEKISPVIEFASQEMEAKQQAAFEKDVAEAVSYLKGDDLKDVPDELTEGFLHRHAVKGDPAFMEAWNNRHRAPETYKEKLAEARKGFRALYKKLPGETVRSDVEAARAAVQGQTHALSPNADIPSPTEMQGWSETKYKQWKREYAAKQGRR